MAATPDQERPLRADAERNRQRILAAASEVFAERGLDVSLDEIAAHAGVGVGTVYRRYPDKDALIDALFEKKLEELADVARGALAIEDPWTAFETFMREVCRLQARDRGLKEALLSADRGQQRVARGRETMAPIGMEILRRAQEAGVVRGDIATFDIPLMHFTVGLMADKARDVAPDYWERLLTILLDGLRAQPGEATPLPSPPLSPGQFVACMTTRTGPRKQTSRP